MKFFTGLLLLIAAGWFLFCIPPAVAQESVIKYETRTFRHYVPQDVRYQVPILPAVRNLAVPVLESHAPVRALPAYSPAPARFDSRPHRTFNAPLVEVGLVTRKAGNISIDQSRTRSTNRTRTRPFLLGRRFVRRAADGGSWGYSGPGNMRTHLINDHGFDSGYVNSLSPSQVQALHNWAHGG